MDQEINGERVLEFVNRMLAENRRESARVQWEGQTLEHFRDMLLQRRRGDQGATAATHSPKPGPAPDASGAGKPWESVIPRQDDQTQPGMLYQLVSTLRQSEELAPQQAKSRAAVSFPKDGSLRDQLLVILTAADGPMSVSELADILEPGAGKSKRTTVRSTLDRMKKAGVVVRVSPGAYQLAAA